MTFFDRYKKACEIKGVEPCSQKAADLIGTTRATISIWNSKNTIPKGETIKAIADAYEVSADFLLGRTDDPIDWSKVDKYEKENACPRILQAFLKLDPTDRIKVESVMEGLLLSDKYRSE